MTRIVNTVVVDGGPQRAPSGHITSSQCRAQKKALGQTRTFLLGSARPLPPSADIGPGGQFLVKLRNSA